MTPDAFRAARPSDKLDEIIDALNAIANGIDARQTALIRIGQTFDWSDAAKRETRALVAAAVIVRAALNEGAACRDQKRKLPEWVAKMTAEAAGAWLGVDCGPDLSKGEYKDGEAGTTAAA